MLQRQNLDLQEQQQLYETYQSSLPKKRIEWSVGGYKEFMKLPPHLVNRVQFLINSIQEGEARGRPEPLSGHDLQSRRINKGNRLVYQDRGDTIFIEHCQGHYEQLAR
jgi:Txe/YoeB family toxin of Txe-Axe toxin-antitoxin module